MFGVFKEPEESQYGWNKGKRGKVSRQGGPRNSRSQIMRGLGGCSGLNSLPPKFTSTQEPMKVTLFEIGYFQI